MYRVVDTSLELLIINDAKVKMYSSVEDVSRYNSSTI